VPLHFTELRKEDLQPFIDKIIKRIAGWKGRLLSYACRLMLLKACLVSTPIYLLSIIKFPKRAIEMINSQMTHFPCNNNLGVPLHFTELRKEDLQPFIDIDY
jgi:hypothetical protein